MRLFWGRNSLAERRANFGMDSIFAAARDGDRPGSLVCRLHTREPRKARGRRAACKDSRTFPAALQLGAALEGPPGEPRLAAVSRIRVCATRALRTAACRANSERRSSGRFQRHACGAPGYRDRNHALGII